MRFSYAMLTQYLDFKISYEQVVENLLQLGLEVEDSDGENIEVAVAPNRPDCLGLIGIARELSALRGAKVVHIDYRLPSPTCSETVRVEIAEPKLCARYLSVVIKGVNNSGISPQWLQDALTCFGTKVISPVVDVTNYVMYEYGQPLHAFNLKALAGGELKVRLAKSGEKLLLLDETTQELQQDTLVIADADKPVALAGVMGGMDSGVWTDTTDIVLECAYFEPVNIRRAIKQYRIHSDAGYRFERGADPMIQRAALERAASMIVDLVGGELGEIHETVYDKHLPSARTVKLRVSRVAKILGLELETKQIQNMFGNLALEPVIEGAVISVSPPSFRQDLESEADLIEEVARLHGINNIAPQMPASSLDFTNAASSKSRERQLAETLAHRGHHEVISYSFISDAKASLVVDNLEPRLELLNPISANMNYMRPSIIPGLLGILQYNLARQSQRLSIFEQGLVFNIANGELQQEPRLTLLATGAHYPESWANVKQNYDFYSLKAELHALLGSNSLIAKLNYKATEQSKLWHPGKAFSIEIDGKALGTIGCIHPSLLEAYELNNTVVGMELDSKVLAAVPIRKYQAFSKYPSTRRDLAIVVDMQVQSADLIKVIRQNLGDLLQDLVIFDVYTGKNIPEGKKSLAFGLTLQAMDRTLLEPELEQLVSQLLTRLEQDCNAVLRAS